MDASCDASAVWDSKDTKSRGNSMKVAYFAFSEEFPAPRAGYVHINEITRNIAKHGVDVTVYAKPPGMRLASDKKENDRTIKFVKFPFLTKKGILSDLLRFPLSYLKLKKDVEDYDLIHERFALLNIWSLFIVRDICAAYLLEVNSPLAEEIPYRFLRPLAKRIRELQFKRCDGIITQTDTLKGILSNFTDKPIFVVPNGVDPEKFTPAKSSQILRKKYAPKGEVLVAFIGAFMKWHGVHKIPEIAQKLSSKHKNVRFLVVGGGPMFGEVKKMCEGLKNVVLTGSMDSEQIPEILASSDILIAPFDTSGYRILERYGFWWSPVKLFEYMASGKPVVSYDFEEVRNIVRDAGLLAQPSNLGQFVECLSRLVEDENLRKRLGKRGRKIAEEEYSWANRAKQTIDVYKKVLSD
jgi:glycosyltransferase involved in cell wall biosynthesis